MSDFNTVNPRPLFQAMYHNGYIDKVIQVSAEVVFGSPSKSCDGYGVCMLTSKKDSPHRSYQCEATPCKVLFTPAEETLVLEFEKTQLSERARAKFFGAQDRFLVEESYRLGLHFLRKGGLEGAWYIPAGSYRIQAQKRYWRISMPIFPVIGHQKSGICEALEVLRAANKKVLGKKSE